MVLNVVFIGFVMQFRAINMRHHRSLVPSFSHTLLDVLVPEGARCIVSFGAPRCNVFSFYCP